MCSLHPLAETEASPEVARLPLAPFRSPGSAVFWRRAGVAMVLLLALLAGCKKQQKSGSGWVRPANAPPPEETGAAGGGADPQADEDIPEEDTQADEESADTEPDRSRNGDDGQSSSADEPAEQEAQRPDDVSQWTPEDFTTPGERTITTWPRQ